MFSAKSKASSFTAADSCGGHGWPAVLKGTRKERNKKGNVLETLLRQHHEHYSEIITKSRFPGFDSCDSHGRTAMVRS